MGVVYEAEELASGRRVALKVLAREHSLSDEAFERFRREARIAASVSDSACVFVFGAHQIEGAPAIAMELCAGETLEHRLRRKDEPIAIADAVRWTIEILDGLEAAHQSGIVHRDVKPSNCFITADGKIKVGDFGLARSLEHDVQLTQSGVFLGSPLYASPEQIKGRQVDFRSDIYSTGATLYALLTGRSPYGGTNLGEVLSRILSEPPDLPTGLRKDIPPGLEKVILRAMAREPSARYASHAAMRDALRPFAAKETRAAGPLRRFCAYMLDGAVLSLINIPLIGIWSRSDPGAIQQIGSASIQVQSPTLQLVLLLSGIIYLSLGEGIFRRTVGKWLTGQRIVVVGHPKAPNLGPYLRSVFWNLPGLLLVLGRFLPATQNAWAQTILGAGPLVVVFALGMLATMRARNGWRGVHEFLSGTRVVAEPLPFAHLVERRAPPPSRLEPADLAPATFGEYYVRGRVGTTRSAEIFEASDPMLDRRVWVHAPLPGAAALQASRRSLDRPTRLRWLDAIDVGGRRHEVFEAPGGARLRDCAVGKKGIDWPTTYRVLTALAEELDAPNAPRASLNQLWIDRSWSPRILDEPLREEGDAGAEPEEEPLQLLAHVARSCAAAGAKSLPADLPEHAEPAVRSLLGLDAPFRSLADARRALAQLAGRPQGLTWKVRGLQMLVGAGLICVFVLVVSVVMQAIGLPMLRQVDEGRLAVRELREGRLLTHEELLDDGKSASGPELNDEQKQNRRHLLATISDRIPAFGTKVSVKLSPEERELLDREKAATPNPTPAEIEAARAKVRADRPPDFDPNGTELMRFFLKFIYAVPWIGTVVFGLGATLFALFLRGGLSLRFLSIAVRNSKGAKAGRLRCLWRAVVSALPFVVLYGLPLKLVVERHPGLAMAALAFAIVVHVGLVFVALRNPARGWQDRIAGTRLVPR
jgi:hypothetical protein